MAGVLKDLRYSLRIFGRSPGFTITAVAALALGIGTNTAIFSVVNAVLLRPMRAPEPDRIVAFLNTSREGTNAAASEIKFNLWREQTSVFEEVSGYRYDTFTLTGVDQPQRVSAILVTSDYFRLFGLPMALGRGFTAEEERGGGFTFGAGARVVALSDAFWRRALGGDPKIVGRTIALNGASYEVVGIMAGGVQTETPEPPDVWLPYPIDPNSSNQVHYFGAVGRLRPGVTIEMANARLQLATLEFRRRWPNTISTSRGDAFSVQPMRDVLVRDVRSSLLTLAGAVSLVLLIACANVANLLLARAAGRRREIAIRTAVGAGRGRIIRQLLTESALLSIAGAAVGAGLGITGIHALLALGPVNIPRIGIKGANVTMDWRVLAFTVTVTLLTGALFGLVPALQASSTDPISALKESGGRSGSGFRQNRTRSLLVVGEMSLALVLLIGAALLIRTLIALHAVNPGFDAHRVMTTRTTLDPRLTGASGVNQMIEAAFRRLRALPGVEAAGLSRLLPLDGGSNSLPFIVVGRPLNGPSHGSTRWMLVSPGYFDALRIPLVRGRFFNDGDRRETAGVVLINQAMARRFWPDGDPLRDLVLIGKGLGAAFEESARQVVGVVGDVRDEALDRDPQPEVYVPAAQIPEARMAGTTVAWVIRTREQSRSLHEAIQSELRQATGGMPVPRLLSMEEIAVQATARQDFNMLLMSVFGGAALLLAAIGIYGLLSYSVQQRTHEIGIRLALGAQSSGVRNMVVAQGMRLVIAGVAIGIASAFGLTRVIAKLLFGVGALDPVVFAAVPVALSAVALAAIWVPARRASRIDPIEALRHE